MGGDVGFVAGSKEIWDGGMSLGRNGEASKTRRGTSGDTNSVITAAKSTLCWMMIDVLGAYAWRKGVSCKGMKELHALHDMEASIVFLLAAYLVCTCKLSHITVSNQPLTPRWFPRWCSRHVNDQRIDKLISICRQRGGQNQLK